MNLSVQTPELALDRGQVITLDDAIGTRIRARIGAVWITEEGSAKDHVLGPGDAFVVANGGRTLVQAMKPSWIALDEGEHAANDPVIERDFDLGGFLRTIGDRYY